MNQINNDPISIPEQIIEASEITKEVSIEASEITKEVSIEEVSIEEVSTEEVSDDKEKIRIRQPSSEELEDIRIIAMSYGVPVSRVVLKHITKNSSLSDSEKKRINKLIDGIHPEITLGCLEFLDNAKRRWYIALDDCSKNHDFNKEMSKIYVSEIRCRQLNDSMGMMFAYVRIIYANIIKEQHEIADLLREAYQHQLDFDQLEVDTEGRMFYINKDWNDRIGFHVKLQK